VTISVTSSPSLWRPSTGKVKLAANYFFRRFFFSPVFSGANQGICRRSIAFEIVGVGEKRRRNLILILILILILLAAHVDRLCSAQFDFLAPKFIFWVTRKK
jgi:hypothetical protein